MVANARKMELLDDMETIATNITLERLKRIEEKTTMESKRWSFTLSNYDEAELDSLRKALQASSRYAIFGKEVGKQGTPHIQGYAVFRNAISFKGAKTLFGDRSHVQVAQGSEQDNFDYCSKDGDFEQFGGKRSNA